MHPVCARVQAVYGVPLVAALTAVAVAAIATTVSANGSAHLPTLYTNASSLYVIRTYRTNSPMFRALWHQAVTELPPARVFVLFDNTTKNKTYIDDAFHQRHDDRIIHISRAECKQINPRFYGMKHTAESMLVLMWRRLTAHLRLERNGTATNGGSKHVDYVWLIESGESDGSSCVRWDVVCTR